MVSLDLDARSIHLHLLLSRQNIKKQGSLHPSLGAWQFELYLTLFKQNIQPLNVSLKIQHTISQKRQNEIKKIRNKNY